MISCCAAMVRCCTWIVCVSEAMMFSYSSTILPGSGPLISGVGGLNEYGGGYEFTSSLRVGFPGGVPFGACEAEQLRQSKIRPS